MYQTTITLKTGEKIVVSGTYQQALDAYQDHAFDRAVATSVLMNPQGINVRTRGARPALNV